MTARFHLLLWLGLLLVSCDKPPEIKPAPEQKVTPPRVTKSNRPAREELPVTPDQLRATLKNAEEIVSPEDRERALEEVAWDALELDPELAREIFHKLTAGGEQKNRLIQHFAMRMAEQALDEAIKWASTLETEQEKSLAFDNIALVLAETEPGRAAQMLSDSGISGRDFDVAVVQVVQRWAAISTTDAAAWVTLFNPGEARSAGLKAVASVWSRGDPQGAIDWLGTIKDQTIHQEAVNGMAETILEMPEESRDEMLRIATPEVLSSYGKLAADAAER